MDFALRLGKKVRKIRLERGMTQAQLGAIANLGANYIPRLERGEMVPSVENTCRIARALGITLDDLCGRGSTRKVATVDLTRVSSKLTLEQLEQLSELVQVLLEEAKSGAGAKGAKRGRRKKK